MRENDYRVYHRFPLNLDTLFEWVLAAIGMGMVIWCMVKG